MFHTHSPSARRSLLLLLAFLCPAGISLAQSISGKILDAASHTPLPFVNIRLDSGEVGGFSDIDGRFSLPADAGDTVQIAFSYLGYASIDTLAIQSEDSIMVVMYENDVQIEEVVIRPDYSYDRYLFKQILARKTANNPEKNPKGDYLDYARTFVCRTNLDNDTKEKRLFKGSESAFIQESDSSLLMPVFFSEEVTQHGSAGSEVIRSKTDGILEQMDQQIQSIINGNFAAQLNFYDEQLAFLKRGFPSPLARGARLFYNIYVVDSAEIDGSKRYKFDFYPKNSHATTFKGSFWVEDSTFALTRVTAALPNSANLNFVRDVAVDISYRKGPDGTWFYDGQTLEMKVSLNKKAESKGKKQSYLIRKTMDYQMPEAWQSGVGEGQSIASLSDQAAFKHLRRTKLDTFELQARDGIATLGENPYVKTVDRLAAMSFTGYLNLGIVDLGPVFDYYRRNAIEGHRFTLSARTSQKLSRSFSVGGYVGLGLKNKEFKYGGQLNLLLSETGRTTLSLNYSDDYFALARNPYIEFVRENPFSQGDGNPISNFTSTLNPFILGKKDLSLSLQLQLKNDIGLLVRPFYKRYQETELLKFAESDGQSFDNRGVLLDARFSFHQKYDDLYFDRFYYGNHKPVIHLTAELGQNVIRQKATPYARLQASVKNRFSLGVTSTRMLWDVGYIAGKVPYPLLHLPQGSSSLGLGRYNYSLLNHGSFASNLYTNLYLATNGGGIIFNRLPLVKQLNLRESLSFKAFYGSLLQGKDGPVHLPKGIFAAPKNPYMEVGVGVSNIFKVLRVEYVHRLGDGPILNQVSSKSGIRARIQVTF